jgi:hypothetical protein
MATSGDILLAIREDFYMARDIRFSPIVEDAHRYSLRSDEQFDVRLFKRLFVAPRHAEPPL